MRSAGGRSGTANPTRAARRRGLADRWPFHVARRASVTRRGVDGELLHRRKSGGNYNRRPPHGPHAMSQNLTFLSWLLYGVPIVLVYAFYLRGRKRRDVEHREQLSTSQAEGLLEPPSLHPVVDPLRCIGSSACVTACPEEALGIIDGKAVLINGAACIGHGACLSACPVEAIKLVFGTERRGMDIPIVKPNFESNVAGIYIAGELGGMGLIRKATEQGRQAAESIRQALGKERAQVATDYDAVIVGCGPAGFGAGLAALAGKLRYRLIEQEQSLGGAVFHYPRNKVAMTAPFNLPLVGKVKFTEVSKEKLLEFWEGVVEKTGLKVELNERMETISRIPEGGFTVKTSRGEYRTRTVLLTIGRRGTPRKLDVPGEESSKVVYRLIDPAQYARQRILVVGGGDSALEAAIALAEQDGTKVTLSYRSESFSRVKEKNRTRLKELEDGKKVRVVLGSTIGEIGEHEVLVRKGEEKYKLKNDAVIVCAGGVLPTSLLQKIGVLFETKHGEA